MVRQHKKKGLKLNRYYGIIKIECNLWIKETLGLPRPSLRVRFPPPSRPVSCGGGDILQGGCDPKVSPGVSTTFPHGERLSSQPELEVGSRRLAIQLRHDGNAAVSVCGARGWTIHSGDWKSAGVWTKTARHRLPGWGQSIWQTAGGAQEVQVLICLPN